MTPFLAFPPEVLRVICTTNVIEALNGQLRKAIKTKDLVGLPTLPDAELSGVLGHLQQSR